MIADKLENLKKYDGVHPLFPIATDFALDLISKKAENGTYYCDADNRIRVIFSTVVTADTREAAAESHEKMIDVQIVLEGEEIMAVPIDTPAVTSPYNSEKDYALYAPVPLSECHVLHVKAGSFAVFFGNELHAPSVAEAGAATVRKAIVKVPVEV